MSLIELLVILLVVTILIGVVPKWPHSANWGYTPAGVVLVILVVLVLLLLLSKPIFVRAAPTPVEFNLCGVYRVKTQNWESVVRVSSDGKFTYDDPYAHYQGTWKRQYNYIYVTDRLGQSVSRWGGRAVRHSRGAWFVETKEYGKVLFTPIYGKID